MRCRKRCNASDGVHSWSTSFAGLIGAALVGTFAGIFMSYGIAGPLAHKIKVTREKRCRFYIIVKQTLLAFMNGAMPQIALEHGRKTIRTR